MKNTYSFLAILMSLILISSAGHAGNDAAYVNDDYKFAKNYCETYVGNMYIYDCHCFGEKFADMKKQFPDSGQDTLFSKIKYMCFSAEKIEAYQKESCLTQGYTRPPGVNAEEYCTCFSKNYSTLLMESPNPHLGGNDSHIFALSTQNCHPILPQKVN